MCNLSQTKNALSIFIYHYLRCGIWH
ncbi:DUF5371 family protein [Winogradskyella thalassocola]